MKRDNDARRHERDSDTRQGEAIQRYASAAGLEIVAEFYDAAVSGADPIDQREGFPSLLAWAQENGVRRIVVEKAPRFARHLIVQETFYALPTRQGFTLIAADDPDAFTADTPHGPDGPSDTRGGERV